MMAIRVGQTRRYYPRKGGKGHSVRILEIRTHLFHRTWVRFAYTSGKEKTIAIERFYETPE